MKTDWFEVIGKGVIYTFLAYVILIGTSSLGLSVFWYTLFSFLVFTGASYLLEIKK
jgi:hypothetical protein